MSDNLTPPPLAEDDRGRPYKALAAAGAAFLAVLLAEFADVLPPAVTLVLGAAVAGLGAYVTPNPKVPATRPANPRPRWRRRG